MKRNLCRKKKKAGGVKKDTGVNEVGNSYVHVVKGQMQPINKESEATPALVLSDECLLSKDLSKSLFGRVKQFTSLVNIRKAVSNEGFADIKIQYMGELWVLLEFVSEDSMNLFQDNVSIGSWFSQLKQASMEFNTEGRIAWVEVKGIPFQLWAFWIRSKEAPGWVPDFMKENDDEVQNDDGGFNVHEPGSCGGDSDMEGENHSRDPFSIYKLLKKKRDNVEKENNLKHRKKYPPGLTTKQGTDWVGMHAEESRSDNIVNLSDHNTQEVNNTFSGNCHKKNSKEIVSNLMCSGHFKTSIVPHTCGSILSLMDELVKVGQVIRYKMDGCLAQKAKKDWVKEICVKNKVNFLALQETKMVNMELFRVKMCWGNFVFDYVHSDSIGVWWQTGNDLLIIAVYAPHDLKDKKILWDYLTYEIGKWKGEVVIMGDFNKVRYKSDRFGSVFNVQGANVLNSFITNAGLEEVLLAKYKDELEALEAIIDKGDGNVEVVNKRMEVVNTLQKIDKICSSEMAQKAKVKWSIEGDENTSFFHGMLNKKRSLLNIQGSMVDGMWIESLNREIKRAVWDCGIDKSPGPDGFTFGFYRRLWNLIENDVYDAIKYFFSYGVIPKGCNLSFIALIPKIPDANTVKDFRTISLIGMHVLECFYRASGLRINMSKSKIMGVLVDSDKVECAALKLGCLILKTPFSYLGSKVGGSMSRVHTWNEVVYRVKNRLFKWKMKTLSIGGRLTLLKSVLGSVPIFHMSIFRASLNVLHTLESIHSQFFNGQEFNSKKASWVTWKKMLAPKEKEGFGVSRLYALNRGLMLKWMWRFYTQNTSLWVRVIKAILGDDGKVGGYMKDGAKSCWLSIVNKINSLKNKGKALKNRYPCIYSLETCKLITMGMKLAHTSLDSSFRRVPRGGVKQEQFDELSALVHDVTLTPMSDRWI
nr:RNA-directed DNA polymerase, eukaryota, reverse transcriptase zinc-binding domain protein [Tanacetum cinerariifolium]